MVLQQVSFVERSSLSQRVSYRRFHCTMYSHYSRESRVKSNLTWNENETVVHYDLNVTYTFEPSMSSGDPKHDKIYTLNIPFYVSLFVSLKF